MVPFPFRPIVRWSQGAIALLFLFSGCASPRRPPPPPPVSRAAPPAPVSRPSPAPQVRPGPPVLLGIDVLEAEGFAPLRGKRIGLLTHAAGVNRFGVSTVAVLRRAPGVRLVSLFSAENGLYGDLPSGKPYPDYVDPRTGLTVHSLYNGKSRRPTKAQLRGIDALVIDLQDIGTRSYTFVSAMKLAMEGCFENGVEVVVLDRPNPLGGLKVDGPPLDPRWFSYVGEFPVPYVHGLTIGELARMAKYQPGILQVSDAARKSGRLTVIPMRGWHRGMRWPQTGLKWVPTSPFIADFPAVVGYPMTGLGCQLGGFFSDRAYPFRALDHKNVKPEVLQADLEALHLPGLDFRRVSVRNPKTGRPGTALYVEISDWNAWEPAELNFYLMKLACRLDPANPFASASSAEANLFIKLMGSPALFRDLAAHGARVDVGAYLRDWRARARLFQEQSRRFWLYD